MNSFYQKTLILIFISLLSINSLRAQEVYTSSGKSVSAAKKQRDKKEKGFDITRLIIGGGAGLSFGTATSVSLRPLVGYRFTDHFSAGVELGYQYTRIRYDYTIWKGNLFSTGLWGRAVIYKNFFVQTEYEHNFMSIHEYDPVGPYSQRFKANVPCLLVGPGVRYGNLDKLTYTIIFLYDVLQQENSPYKNYSNGINYDIRLGVNLNF